MAFSGIPFADTQINTTAAGEQIHPAIAGIAGGGHVVVWTSASGQDRSGGGVYGQRFDAAGQPVGSKFAINTTTDGSQDYTDVVALAGRGFVETWTSADQDGSFDGVYMQRFSATGQALGNETLVNTKVLSSQSYSQVTALAGGGHAVVWADYGTPASVRLQI